MITNYTSAVKFNFELILKSVFAFIFLLGSLDSLAQTYYTKSSNGANWGNLNAWEIDVNGSRVKAKFLPNSSNPVIITRSINIPRDSTFNCKSVTILPSGINVELSFGGNSLLTVDENVHVYSPASSGIRNRIEVNANSTLEIKGNLLLGNNPAQSTNEGEVSVLVKSNATNGVGKLIVNGLISNNSGVPRQGSTYAPCELSLEGRSILEIGGTLGIGSKLTGDFATNSNVRFNGTTDQTIPAEGIFGNLIIANTEGVSLLGDLNTSNLLGNLIIESGKLEDKGFPISGKNAKDLIIWNGGNLVLTYAQPVTKMAFPTGFGTLDLQSGSTVTYNGGPIQRIAAHNYGNLELLGGTNSQKFLVGNTNAENTYVGADLMLDNGSLSIGNNTLTLASNGSIQNFNSAKYIKLGASGKMVVEKIGQTLGARNTEVVFPIGTSKNYSPAYLTNNGTTYDFSVKVTDGVVDYATNTPILQDGVNKTWDIECINQALGSNPDVEVRLQWNTSDQLIGFKPAQCYVTHYTSNAWSTSDIFQNATQSSLSANMRNVTSFSPFSVASSPTPLPVELLYFKATKNDNGVLLTWETASEKNSLGYDLLASPDGVHFEAIALIASKNGIAQFNQRYEFLDKASRSGLVYYRLKQTDLDGTITYYATQVVNMGRFAEVLTAYPNPFQDKFELKLKVETAQEIQLSICDLTGKTVYQKAEKVPAGENLVPVALSKSLPAGVYILTAKTSGQLFTSKLVKQ